MYEPFNLDKEEVRRQYIIRLIPDRFSVEASRKGLDVSSGESGDNSYHAFTKLINRGLTYFEERLRDYCDDLRDTDLNDEKSVRTLMNEFTYMEDYLEQTYRNRRTKDTREFKDAPEGDESAHMYIHQEVLTRVHPDFLQDVNLDGTNILDRMVQDQLMTEDERESIIEEKTSRRRKEAFLMLMRGRLSYETLLNNFIPAIELDHPDIARKIKAATVEIKGKAPNSHLCAVCNMKQTVDVKHLAEHLYSKGAISADLYEELRRSLGSIASKWSGLLSEVSNSSFIAEAIQLKFPSIYDSLKEEKCTDLECRCWAVTKPYVKLEDLSKATGRSSDVVNLDDLRSLIDPGEVSGSQVNAGNAFLDGSKTMLEQKFTSGQSEYLQVNKMIGEQGGQLSLTILPQTQVLIPIGALVKEIIVGLQAQILAPELIARHLGSPDAASAIVTVEPRRRRFHKFMTLLLPRPKGALRSPKNIVLLRSLVARPDADVWKDVSESTELNYGTECVSFTSRVSARFWLIECADKSKCEDIANALYKDAMIGSKGNV